MTGLPGDIAEGTACREVAPLVAGAPSAATGTGIRGLAHLRTNATTSGGGRHDASDVRAALAIADVFRWGGVDLVGRGRERRAGTCPACGGRSRVDTVAVNCERGLWHCHRCGTGGDMLAAVAGFAALDIVRDFPRVVAIGAALAGLEPSRGAADQAARREAWERRGRAERERLAAGRADAIRRAASLWSALARDHARGRAYLDSRGLDAAELVERGVVRFWRDGSPALALYGTERDIRNVFRRRIENDGGPKVLGLRGCPRVGTLLGSVDEIAGRCSVVICEGVTDALAARCAWGASVVLGAQCADTFGAVARHAAPQVKRAGGRLLLCVDDDAAGERAGCEAVRAAVDAGLDLGHDLEIVDLADHHDLANAWAAGWRP